MCQDFLPLLLSHKRSRQVSQNTQYIIEGNLPVTIQIINFEYKFNLMLQTSPRAEGRQEGNKLLEIQPIKHSQQPLGKGIDGELGNGEELIAGDESTTIAIELAESMIQRHDLLLGKSVIAVLLDFLDVVLGEH